MSRKNSFLTLFVVEYGLCVTILFNVTKIKKSIYMKCLKYHEDNLVNLLKNICVILGLFISVCYCLIKYNVLYQLEKHFEKMAFLKF